eukprot:TRINITY_DN2675_c0_g1_i1.p1 TRINITY_DN2675_c0_g1~~TRINITY_DN2675_c0_g1_i1.p1  ORF type:complete len:760 (+),score=91.18 TRINITY_DN2675_c0_g1_i1:42-2282(+)
MQTIEHSLNTLFRAAIQKAYPNVPTPRVSLSPGRKTDYQCNNAMPLLAQLKQLPAGETPPPAKPNDIAEQIAASLPDNNLVTNVNCFNGFINFDLSKEFVADRVNDYVKAGIQPPVQEPTRVMVDFSSPNIAKDMHVGHLRSTIMGECISRVLEFCGHSVMRINHVGDWGTQFGMLITHLTDEYPNFKEVPPPITELVQFYKASKARFDADADFKDRAHKAVVALQSGDESARQAWQILCKCSREAFQEVYSRLDVTIEERGESFYNPYLADAVKDCLERKIAHIDNGAAMIVSCETKQLDTLTQRDVERILTLHICNQPLSSSPKFVALLEAEGLIGDGEGEGAEKVLKPAPTDKKGKPIPLSQFSSTLQKPDVVGRTVQGLALALCEKPQKGGGKKQGAAALVLKPAFVEFLQTIPGVIIEKAVNVPRFNTPFMIQKSDGGFGYGTTDLAALKYRTQVDKAQRIVYVTDMGQEGHFMQAYQAGRDAGYVAPDVKLEHVGFGLVLAPDGKKFKTRSGTTERLQDLLDEAPKRLYMEMQKRQKERIDEAKEKGTTFEPIPDEEMKKSADVIGYGAIKYFDLKSNRVGNYTFSYDAMLDLKGNTAVYLEYAYARYRAIARKAGVSTTENPWETFSAIAPIDMGTLIKSSDSAFALALHLARYPSCIEEVTETLLPHKLCDYLYHLTEKCNVFYDKERVLKSTEGEEEGSVKLVLTDDGSTKLTLTEAATRVMAHGLKLLGISTVERL